MYLNGMHFKSIKSHFADCVRLNYIFFISFMSKCAGPLIEETYFHKLRNLSILHDPHLWTVEIDHDPFQSLLITAKSNEVLFEHF